MFGTRRRLNQAAVGAASLLLASICLLIVTSGGSSADPLDPKVQPDIVVNVGETKTVKNDEVLVGGALNYGPDVCRGEMGTLLDAGGSESCVAYRVKLNLDPNPLAQNTVFFSASFEQTQLPGLPLVAAGLNPPPINGYDVYVYDDTDHYLGQNAPSETTDPILGPGDPEDLSPGGNSFAQPEIGSFIAKQDTYDFVLHAAQGITSGVTFKISLSNEVFPSPAELLENLGAPNGPIAERETGDAYAPPFVGGLGEGVVEGLPTLDIAPDDALAGIGLGTTEQFDRDEAIRLGQAALRNVSISNDPPSAIMLLLGLLGLPLAFGIPIFVVMRRRRDAFTVA